MLIIIDMTGEEKNKIFDEENSKNEIDNSNLEQIDWRYVPQLQVVEAIKN